MTDKWTEDFFAPRAEPASLFGNDVGHMPEVLVKLHDEFEQRGIVTWGRHPSHGDVWLKLWDRTTAKYREARRAEGWEVVALKFGAHPDDVGADQ